MTRQQLLQLWQDTLELVQGGSGLRPHAVQVRRERVGRRRSSFAPAVSQVAIEYTIIACIMYKDASSIGLACWPCQGRRGPRLAPRALPSSRAIGR